MVHEPTKPPSVDSSKTAVEIINQQDLLLKNLCSTIPGQHSDSSFQVLKAVLVNLSGTHLRKLLIDCFPPKELDHFQKHIGAELETMNRVNHSRMKSLVDLAEPGLRKAVHESLLLFDINPEELGTLNLEKVSGYDDAGKPIIEISEFDVFPINAAYGIADRE